jgi:hypothetical protein
VIRASGFSPVTVALALLGGAIGLTVGGLRGLAVCGGAVIAARVLSGALVAVLADIDEHEGARPDRDELVVWPARGVQSAATCMSIALLDEEIRTADGIIAVVIYAGCVLVGWAVRKAAMPAIARLLDRLCRLEERLAMDGRGVSKARIRDWNDAWTRALEHIEHERRAAPPAG